MNDSNALTAFSTAAEFLCALRSRAISARELLDVHLRRMERYDPALNSIVVKDIDRARLDAHAADERRARGDDAPLLGLPITVKESVDVEGLPSTAGVPFRVGHRAPRDALTVHRLRAAGAIVFGKTNVCTWLADFQADNPVYGRTNSPWDMTRTPGGSSGGSATLAAGLTPLDLGSDLGGSIRIPAAFCGLWGHKPSEGAVPNSGHFPGSERPNPAVVLAAQGPLARSAHDLELALDAIAGPDIGMDAGWRLTLPPARHERLADFRVAVVPAQAWLAVDDEVVAALHRTCDALRQAGATVVEMQPEQLGDLGDHYALFRSMMWVINASRWSAEQRQAACEDKLGRDERFHAADVRGIRATGGEHVLWHEQRESYRAGWRDFFSHHDVLLTPMTLTPAFEHTRVANADRRLRVNGHDVEFEYMSFYPSLPGLAGQPATAIPAGFSRAGLPLGLQVVGPFLEDRTTLRFAQLLEALTGAFGPPGTYDAVL